MEYNKQTSVTLANPDISKSGKRFILLAIFGGFSFYTISSMSWLVYHVFMKLFG